MTKTRNWLGALAITSLVALIPYPAAADPVISVDAADYIPTPPPYPGSTAFVVPVEIQRAVGLMFWQFDLTYNPTDVQIYTSCDPFSSDPLIATYCSLLTGSQTEGPFFGSLSPFNTFNPGFVLLDSTTLEQTGQLMAVNDRFGGDTPPSGDGILAYVLFVTTESGTGASPITVTNVSTESAVPEPATLALLATGLLLVGGRRVLRHQRRK